MTLDALYTKKQQQVLRAYKRNDWRFMINYGAVRAGKTVVDNDMFLMELKRVRKIADKMNIDEPMYILAGVSSKTIQNNVLQELTNKYGLEFKFDRNGAFKLFGVKIILAYTGSIAGLGSIRGMTAFGAYINEASLANQNVFAEIVNRCSVEGSRIILDTNPDNPEHWLKKNYIDNQDEDAKIVSFHFTMDDNTFLSDDYIKTQKASVPSGMLYDRAILGLWVSGEGMVYSDFDKRKTAISIDDLPQEMSYYVGVDWGYADGHPGVIVVFGDDEQGNTYLVEEYSAEHREIDYWVEVAKEVQQKYGYTIPYYCDSARPEHIERFIREGINGIYADKSKLAGIEEVATRIKSGRFFVVEQNMNRFYDEIYQYVWDERKGEPIKKNDDVMDAMRYAIYNYHLQSGSGLLFSKRGV